MPKTLVTGMSGTGKSTALRILGARGHHVVDTDSDTQGHLFVAGCKSNQGKFYPQFDHIALLRAPAPLLFARIAARADNPYGKVVEERATILHHLAVGEPLLRATATVEIDASAPIDDVVRRLEELK